EPNNFVEHFIDSTGVVSWRFFSSKADVEFSEWDFCAPLSANPSPEERQQASQAEADSLFAILADMGLEVYCAGYNDLGVP
ncbi:hypothetical protein Q4595_29775, partial [Wenyingzhuangia sp. 1_MG-2023]|nr:hypothetical protein [Wenyingzhuangia sp. 1_MG-2023]